MLGQLPTEDATIMCIGKGGREQKVLKFVRDKETGRVYSFRMLRSSPPPLQRGTSQRILCFFFHYSPLKKSAIYRLRLKLLQFESVAEVQLDNPIERADEPVVSRLPSVPVFRRCFPFCLNRNVWLQEMINDHQDTMNDCHHRSFASPSGSNAAKLGSQIPVLLACSCIGDLDQKTA